jgi:hypothetical protein
VELREFTLSSLLKDSASLKAFLQGKALSRFMVLWLRGRHAIVLGTTLVIDFHSGLGCVRSPKYEEALSIMLP